MPADKFRCRDCLKNVAATGQSPSPLRYRKHDKDRGAECPLSRTIIPAWIVKRGPEAEDSDVPAVGRDYAPCPDCGRSPLLDDEGKYALHIKVPGVPSADRVNCPKSGKPYTPEGEECLSDDPSPKAAPATAAPPETPATDGSATTPTSPRSTPAPTQAEQMLSKWATTVREIEDRKLPESSPVSTPTPQALPRRPDAPEAPPESDAAPLSGDASSATPSGVSPSPPDISPQSAPTLDGTAASAGPTPADVLEAATREVQKVMPGATVEYDSTPIPILKDAAPSSGPDAAPSTAATLPTPVDALPSRTSPFAQPGSPFSQPAKLPAAVTSAVPMTVLAEQVAARMKELFFSYGNRKTGDNRAAQVTLGPSAIGSPCDRRIAMSLLRIPAVNPGGDGWAAFKGTAIHAALAELFTWASADTGRFAVEVPLRFPSEHVPGGTTDLLDRVLFMVDDHKIQSRWSQDRLRVDGMTATQRVQLHTYGFGARLQGEVVDHVALISWPMESSSLDDLYAVIEPYDPQIARDALARVDRIAAEAKAHQAERATWAGLDIARTFDVADDCKFCEWHAPGDAKGERGCNGRK